MKWIGRALYIFLVLVIGFFVINIASMRKRYTFYEEKTKDLIENYNRDNRAEYIKYYMTATNVKEYYKDPVYVGVDNDYSLEFGIYHAKYIEKSGEGEMLFFHFRDVNKNIKSQVSDLEKFERELLSGTELALIKIEIYMDNETKPISYKYDLDKFLQMPLPLLDITKDKDENDVFKYKTADDAGKELEKEANTITKIELTLLDGSGLEKPSEKDIKWPETTLLSITHNNDVKMESEDLLVLNESGILVSNNFNGNISEFLFSDKYNDQTKGPLVFKELEAYNYITRKSTINFSIVVVVVTYLIFFLKPTIRLIKEKELFKRKNKNEVVLESNNVTDITNEDNTKDIEE